VSLSPENFEVFYVTASNFSQSAVYATNAPDLEEFIELQNITPTNVPLYDPAYPTNVWHLANAVTFNFPKT
jgi:hypothetical protein